MFSFFIDRPIFAAVISIIIVIAGLMALKALPVEQYPDVVPPQVVVEAFYPGASAEIVAESVAAPLEQEINGVDNMIYMETGTTDSGSMQISISFERGTDPDQAAINVNNRVQAALARLPQSVRDQGVRVEARSANILMVAALYSPGSSRDTLFLSNYALLNILDALVRLPGVGDASLFGAQDYSMRIWLRPDQLAQYNLTPGDVAQAVREQSAQFAAGRIGAQPAPADQGFTFTITARGQLATPEEFENIILRSGTDGATLRLRDVARAELGAVNYDFSAIYNGQSAVPMGVFLQPGANALETAAAVRATMQDMQERFPDDVAYSIPYDTTEFIEISIREVFITLSIAIALVILVTYLFLQSVRATLIPAAAIPVSLIGTFAGMLMLGFSVNLLTLFGLVLAIGIVVDNAIIVLENVDRLMREKKLSSYAASVKTMEQVAGAVLASTLVLVAVFVPVSFMGGLTGELYRQFAVTIAVSVVVSGVVALTLTPAMCAILLKKGPQIPAAPFRLFNTGLDKVTAAFGWLVDLLVRRVVIGFAAFILVIAAGVGLMMSMPSGLIPQEDQGLALVAFELPPVSALGRSEAVRDQLSEQLLQMEEVEEFTAFAGFDIIASALRSHSGIGFINLADWSQRTGPGQDAGSIAMRVMGIGAGIPEANIFSFIPPPIMGLSLTGGVEGYIQMRGDATPDQMEEIGGQLMQRANAHPAVTNARISLNALIPRYRADVDRENARAMNVPINLIFETMQSTFGSLYVNDFIYQGRNWQVNLQSESDFRARPEDISKIYVRSENGVMIPLSSLVHLERVSGPDINNRFNLSPAVKFLAEPAPGFTSAQAKQAIEELARDTNSAANQISWIGEAYQLDAAAGAGMLAFVLGLVMVFLILSAQYERWSLPVAVLTAVPFAVLGAALASSLRGFPNDIYFQIGLLVLIGLAAKNAILIVEFAAQNHRAGMPPAKAAGLAARQRFRAIMMTALTFIIGSLPLMLASGAGAASRQEIGTVVVGGMIFASTLALLFVPVFYRVVEKSAEAVTKHDHDAPEKTKNAQAKEDRGSK